MNIGNWLAARSRLLPVVGQQVNHGPKRLNLLSHALQLGFFFRQQFVYVFHKLPSLPRSGMNPESLPVRLRSLKGKDLAGARLSVSAVEELRNRLVSVGQRRLISGKKTMQNKKLDGLTPECLTYQLTEHLVRRLTRSRVVHKNVQLTELGLDAPENSADLLGTANISLNQEAIRPALANLRQRSFGCSFVLVVVTTTLSFEPRPFYRASHTDSFVGRHVGH